jgi:tetratricopeptide (TPR) repeat protein
LKAPGFNAGAFKVKNRFQIFVFKCNLYRYIKDKGDAFFKAGNFRSALVAYTQAVETEKQAPHPDGTLVRLYANRAACVLKGGDAESAVEDCTAALALLESEVGGLYKLNPAVTHSA